MLNLKMKGKSKHPVKLRDTPEEEKV